MVQFSSVCSKVFLIFCIVKEIRPKSEESAYFDTGEGVGWNFGKLLTSIANINEKRLKAALKKEHIVDIFLLNDNNSKTTTGLFYKNYDNGLHEAPRYIAVQDILQIMNEHYDNDSDESAIINRNQMHEIEKLIRHAMQKTFNKLSDEGAISYGEDNLRSWSSCSRRATKRCKKACNKAYKAVCSDYRCSKSMKRSFKKHCKAECKNKFQYD